MHKDSLFSTSFPILLPLLITDILTGMVWYPTLILMYSSLIIIIIILSSFHIPVGHSYDFFWEMPIQIFCPLLIYFLLFFFTLWNYMGFLYSLDINPLLDVAFVKIISHSIGCLFMLLNSSFVVQKLFCLMKSHLSIFASSFGVISKKKKKKKSVPKSISRRFSPYVFF